MSADKIAVVEEKQVTERKEPKSFPKYAAEFLTIRPKEGTPIKLTLNPVQKRLNKIADEQRAATGRIRLLVLKARQPGVSTYVEARFYWRTAREKGLRAFILTHKDEATTNLFEMAKRFHGYFPEDGRPRLARSNTKELKFATLDSSYRVGTARADGVGRSDTVQLFHGSEVAHWPHAERHAAGALQAVPDAEGTEIWLESTANGSAGLFYNMCMRAEAGIGEYKLVFIPWFDHAEYKRSPPNGWVADGEWDAYAEKHSLTRTQLYWAWMKNAELAGSSGENLDRPCWLFRQEYPATVEDAFQTSGIDSYISAAMAEAAREAIYPTDRSAPLIFGMDVAHGGADRTHIIDRRGRRLGYEVNLSLDDADEMVLAGRLGQLIDEHHPDMVFVDITGGYGCGVVDRLRERGFDMVRGINFATRATDSDKYANKRAEMWAGLRTWLLEGAATVDDATLRRHLSAPSHKTDGLGRLLLEKKDDIRKRLGLSPDRADAAALTFAEPVRRKSAGHGPESTRSVYDALEY